MSETFQGNNETKTTNTPNKYKTKKSNEFNTSNSNWQTEDREDQSIFTLKPSTNSLHC